MDSFKRDQAAGARWKIGVVLAILLGLVQGRMALADERTEANQLVEKAQLTLNNLMCDDGMGALRSLMQRAEGVLIVPELLRGGFVVGASGGEWSSSGEGQAEWHVEPSGLLHDRRSERRNADWRRVL